MSAKWWHGAVIYQVCPRSFQDGDGDGVGDLPGLLRRLDYVASLGVDAVWITPFFRSPMQDFGYDVADYRAVDPLFGTMADFEQVLARAHGLGLKVLVDMVWAHTSDRHPWFVDSRAARTGDKADWYVWADARPDGTPPNNWLGVFGGGAWTWEPRRRQYYLHHFLACQPALNWRHPAVAEALLAEGAFWLDKGVDGFRLDAMDFLLHDPGLRDNPSNPQAEIPSRPFAMQHHVHDMVQPDMDGPLARIRGLMDRFGDTLTIAEMSRVGDPFARAADYTRPGLLHSSYSLAVMRRPLARFTETLAEVQAKAGGGMCWAFSNHDIERVVSRWGDGSPDSARALLALLLSLPGPVCLYQGEELGLTEADLGFDDIRDPFGIAFWPDFKGRDGCRTPMPWTAEGGFTSGRPWLPIPDEHRALAVDLQEAEAGSTLDVARRMIRLRRDWLKARDLRVVAEAPLVMERGALSCVFNLSPAPARVACPGRLIEAVGCRQEGEDLVFAGWGVGFVGR